MSQNEEYSLNMDEPGHFKAVMTKLDLMREERKYCDVTITVESKHIHAHKDVICAASDYFNAMFSHDTLEKQQGIVAMKDMKYDAVKKCIDFIYSGKLSASILQCDDILTCVTIMQLIQACEKIEYFLQEFLNVENFFLVRDIALKFTLKNLLNSCNLFAVANIVSLSKVENFNTAELSFIASLISSDDLSISEDDKLACVLQWANADRSNREANLVGLLLHVRAPKLSPGYCEYLMEQEPICHTSVKLVRHLFSAVVGDGKIKTFDPLDILSEAKIPYHNSLILFNETVEEVMSYSPADGELKSVIKYSDEMKSVEFTSCSLKSVLYIIYSNNQVFSLNLKDESISWTSLPNYHRSHGKFLRCAIYHNHIYVGGNNSLEKLDLTKNGSWEDVDLEENICEESKLMQYEDFLFVIGGRDNHGKAVNNVMKRSPSIKWMTVCPMNYVRIDPSAVVLQSTLYVGVDPGNNALEMYEIGTNIWTIITCKISPVDLNHFKVDNDIFGVCIEDKECFIVVFDAANKVWNEKKAILAGEIWESGTTTAFW